MNIKYIGHFKKHFRLRIEPNSNLKQRFLEKIYLFTESPSNPTLQEHALTGKKKNFRAFSITGDIRIIYFIKGGDAYFIDVGTHNQVY